MRIVIVVALLLTGCPKQKNPDHCSDDRTKCPDSMPACSIPLDTCACNGGMCKECTAAGEKTCTGTTPGCGIDNHCGPCRSNDHCPSDSACLEDGTCADPSRIIAVSPGDNTSTPCGAPGQSACSIMTAPSQVTASRDVIRLAAGNYQVGGTEGMDFGATSATVVARGATITRMAPNGPIMSVRNSQALKLIGGTLQGPNNTLEGVRCNSSGRLQVHEATIENMTEHGIKTDACELTVSRSTIRENRQGGIFMLTALRVARITNNFVYRNGGGTSQVGGMSLRLESGSALEFNTVVNNQTTATMGFAGGIFCESNNNYEPPFNIVYRNQGGLGNMVQVIGSCVFQPTKSYVLGTPDPNENMVGFEDPNKLTNPSFRLTAGSPEMVVRDVSDCRDLIDVEGDARPAPAGGKCDYGADEFRQGQ